MTNCSEVCGYASAVAAQPTGQEESWIQVLALKSALTCPRRTVSPSWVSVSTLDLPPTKVQKGHFPLRFQEQRALLVGCQGCSKLQKKEDSSFEMLSLVEAWGAESFFKKFTLNKCVYIIECNAKFPQVFKTKHQPARRCRYGRYWREFIHFILKKLQNPWVACTLMFLFVLTSYEFEDKKYWELPLKADSLVPGK